MRLTLSGLSYTGHWLALGMSETAGNAIYATYLGTKVSIEIPFGISLEISLEISVEIGSKSTNRQIEGTT